MTNPQVLNPSSQPISQPAGPSSMGGPGAALMGMATGAAGFPNGQPQGFQPQPYGQPQGQPFAQQPQFVAPAPAVPQQPAMAPAMPSTPPVPFVTPTAPIPVHQQFQAVYGNQPNQPFGAGVAPAAAPVTAQQTGAPSPVTPLQQWQQQQLGQQSPFPQTNQPGQPPAGHPGQPQPVDDNQDFIRQILEADRARNEELNRLRNDFNSVQQQLQQTLQPQAAQPQTLASLRPQFDFENWPEVDPVLLNHYREVRTDDKGNSVTTWKDGTPTNIRAAGDAMMQQLDSWATSLLYQPNKILPEMIRKYAREEAERIVGDRVTATENSLRLDQLLNGNDWLYQQDPQTGRPILSDYGRQVIGMAEFDPGKPPTAADVQRLETALEVVRLKRENEQLRLQQQQLQPGQQPSPHQQQQQAQSQELDRQVSRFQQIAQRTQQGYDPRQVAQNGMSRMGSFPQDNGNAPQTHVPQNGYMSPGTRMVNGLKFGTSIPANGNFPAMAN